MNQPVLGIIGGGQLASMLSEAAKKIDITIANLFKNWAIFLVLDLANQFKNK